MIGLDLQINPIILMYIYAFVKVLRIEFGTLAGQYKKVLFHKA